jgi:hypothetical protein
MVPRDVTLGTMHSLLSNIETVPTDSLITHPDNARRGDINVIAESLGENQQYLPLVVQASTRYVLSGNHTLLAARQLEWETVDVVLVDVDDEHAVRIMLSANRTADLGEYDDTALLKLLESLDGEYEGTGYDADDYDDLLALLGQVAETPYLETTAAYAETAEEMQARADKLAEGGSPLIARGIRETVVILPQDEHDELHQLLGRARASLPSKDLTNGEVVLRAVRALVGALVDGLDVQQYLEARTA